MPPKTQVNSSTGIMGVTGSGKSSLLATLARSVWERWRKVTLCYVSDGGGFPAEVQALMALGIMRVFRMQTRDPGDLGLSFETCYRACQGWWPRQINPATGEVPPGVEMVPPVVLRYQMACAQGHPIKEVPSQAMLVPTQCPQCRKMVTKAEMIITKTVKQNKGFEQVGAVCFDGLTSMLGWELRELGHRAGKMELRGEESALGGKVESGDLKFGGVTRSHVGFAQTRGEELVHLALGIPNLVVPPVFTMLTHEDVDDRSLSIIGPKIAGRAKTDEASQWFGNMLESAKIPAVQGTGEQRVLYLSEFTDSNGVRHLLKHRGSPGTMPDMLLDPPNDDAPFSQFNLGVFFELLNAALERRINDVHAEFPDAPGVVDGWVEFGDSSVTLPQPLPTAVADPQAAVEHMAARDASHGNGQAQPSAAPPSSAPAPRARVRAKQTAPAGPPAGAAASADLVSPAPVPVVAAPSTPGAFPPASTPAAPQVDPAQQPQSPHQPPTETPTPPHPPAPSPKPPGEQDKAPKPQPPRTPGTVPTPGQTALPLQPQPQPPAAPVAGARPRVSAAPPAGRRPVAAPAAVPVRAPAAAPHPPTSGSPVN